MLNILSENINRIMYERNISQVRLAKLSGVSRQTINNIVSNTLTADPKLSTIYKISNALQIEFNQIFERRETFDKNNNSNISFDTYYNNIVQKIKFNTTLYTQKSLSSSPGLSESTISNFINSKTHDIRLSTLEYFSKQLNISISELMKRG